MDKYLKPDRFSTDPNTLNSEKEWIHWVTTFENFVSSIETEEKKLNDSDKFSLLINFISPTIYEYISELKSYDGAKSALDKIYKKPTNEIFSRYLLASRNQDSNESIDQYIQALKLLSKNCNFQAVSLEEHRDAFIRDSFIGGLLSPTIRQRLLENTTLTLNEAIDKARTLEAANKHAEIYNNSSLVLKEQSVQDNSTQPALNSASVETNYDSSTRDSTLAASSTAKCYFCGNNRHSRKICPARDAICHKCSKKGHFSKVCKSKSQVTSASLNSQTLTLASISSLSKALMTVYVNNYKFQALVDTGSSESFINYDIAKMLKVKLLPGGIKVAMASTALSTSVKGLCFVNLEFQGQTHKSSKLLVLKDLCADVIIGHDILKEYESLALSFGGTRPPLSICALASAQVPLPTLFANLTSDCHPICTKSRKHTQEDRNFIKDEVKRLLSEGIIEESRSPWRAQALVVSTDSHKRRMVIDYSQTINRFTHLDAYPLPNIEELIAEVAKNSVFSTIDLKSAYHQIPIRDEEKPFTAFEADGSLYQFCRIPFGITNGVACFQRVIDKIISNENLTGVYAYLDDVTICGKDQIEHDSNLKRFLGTVQKYGLTLNTEKSKFSQTCINLLGYNIQNKTIRPDPDRLKPLIEFPLPNNSASLKRAIGMFSHFSRFVYKFSEKIRILTNCKTFPLSSEAQSIFNQLKDDIAKTSVNSIDEKIPFQVETDASEYAIAATLSQAGRPIAFFSRPLSKSEFHHSAVEKEAYAIVEALKKWRHYLIGRHFKLVTDQKSVAFMFDSRHSSKIKNEKVFRWRLELSCFSYDIVYRPGKDNVVADSFSRICGSTNTQNLYSIHNSLCHPGVTRMMHWIKCNNLPYSVDDVRKMTASCGVCAEIKPRFYNKSNGKLIKATTPFERLSIDFKGPIPSSSRNHFLLTVVDEFSRFPFAFPCYDMTSKTVIRNLSNIFSIFGMPSFIHTDRGSSFLSEELKSFLHSHDIATSHTTPYNPRGNGQVECYNGIIWRTIMLYLKTNNLPITQWEQALPQALNAIRSLLCTTTNATPHERMFNHTRKFGTTISLPTWLTLPGPVFMRKHVRNNKYEPLVEEVDLIDCNPQYATVHHKDGRQSTVSLRHLAPRGIINENYEDRGLQGNEELNTNPVETSNFDLTTQERNIADDVEMMPHDESPSKRPSLPAGNQVRKSYRFRRPPSYLKEYVSK